MRILGIDPGSSVTGFGVVERRGAGVVYVAHGTLRPPRSSALAERLALLYAGLTRAIAEHRPDVAAVERVFAGRSPRSALVLGHARGIALAAAASAGVPVQEYTAPEIKLAVAGTGTAEKRQVQAMVRRLLALARPPASDAADALAAALCHAHRGPLAALGTVPRSRGRRVGAGGQASGPGGQASGPGGQGLRGGGQALRGGGQGRRVGVPGRVVVRRMP